MVFMNIFNICVFSSSTLAWRFKKCANNSFFFSKFFLMIVFTGDHHAIMKEN